MKNITTDIVEHFCAFGRGVRSIFEDQHPENYFERVVFVVGVNSAAKSEKTGFPRFLRKNFPHKEIVLVQEYYLHTQEDGVEGMITRTLKELSNTDKKTLIITHSFGGMIARAAIARMDKTSHITLLATLATPHTMEKFEISKVRKVHKIPDDCTVPILTFGGRADMVVPEEFTRFTGEVGHITISCTHLAFLHYNRTRKEVIDGIMQYLRHKNH